MKKLLLLMALILLCLVIYYCGFYQRIKIEQEQKIFSVIENMFSVKTYVFVHNYPDVFSFHVENFIMDVVAIDKVDETLKDQMKQARKTKAKLEDIMEGE
jgi:hypothetical protein